MIGAEQDGSVAEVNRVNHRRCHFLSSEAWYPVGVEHEEHLSVAFCVSCYAVIPPSVLNL